MAAHQNKTVKSLVKHLHSLGIPYFDLRSQEGDRQGVRLATFHKVKGMEFRVMFLLGLSEATLPHRFRGFNLLSESNRTKAIQMQKALMYVGMSRARDVLELTGVGKPSTWVGWEDRWGRLLLI